MRETLTSVAGTQCALNALEEAERAESPEDQKFHLNQAAIFAHLAEQARHEEQTTD